MAEHAARLLLVLSAVCLWITACGGGEAQTAEQSESPQDQQQVQVQGQEEQSDAEESPLRERVLDIPAAVIGDHLVRQPIEAGLSDWLLASRDPVLAELPERARFASGNLYSAAADSPTGETFWLHIFTDETFEGAMQWVEYAAEQDPSDDGSLARELVRHHERYAASRLETPELGEAALAVELLHGHSGICVRSHLLVFAQEGVVMFLFASIEITGEPNPSLRMPSGAADNCDIARAAAALTDNRSIARWISEWLADDDAGVDGP